MTDETPETPTPETPTPETTEPWTPTPDEKAELEAFRAAQKDSLAPAETEESEPVGFADPDTRDAVLAGQRVEPGESAVFLAGTGHNDE